MIAAGHDCLAPTVLPVAQPVKAYCAWCRQEGRNGDLGEREPYSDPRETHGVCDRHQQELLATLPSMSFPGVQLLLVIAAKEEALYEYLRPRLASVKGVRVMIERRHGDRRRQGRSVPGDRRKRDRRVRRGQASALGYTLVRFGKPPAEPALAPEARA
jgi:hypothetical protein